MMTKLVKTIIVLTLVSSSAFGATKEKKMMEMMEMTSEQRQTMATAHEKMALCLRSEKPTKECHDEMNQSCMDSMGKDGCHMMMGEHKMKKEMKK